MQICFWKLPPEFAGEFCGAFLVLQWSYPFPGAIPVHIINIVMLTAGLGWSTIHSGQIHPIGTCSLPQRPLSENKIWHTVF